MTDETNRTKNLVTKVAKTVRTSGLIAIAGLGLYAGGFGHLMLRNGAETRNIADYSWREPMKYIYTAEAITAFFIGLPVGGIASLYRLGEYFEDREKRMKRGKK